MADLPKAMRLMAEYECWPLWNSDPDAVGWDYNIDPALLPISAELQVALDAWAADFDAILNPDDPAASDFASQAEADAFEAQGRELLARLRQELPSVRWTYRSV